jgi:hypothetical protein
MARKKVSSTDLIWIFHQKLETFDDHPLHGLPIAIVPMSHGEWKALTTHYVQKYQKSWRNRIEAIEKELQKIYVLMDD